MAEFPNQQNWMHGCVIIYYLNFIPADAQKERTLDFILVLRVLRLVRLMNSLPQ